MNWIDSNNKTTGLLRYVETGKFEFDIPKAKQSLKNIDRVFVGRTNKPLDVVFKEQKQYLWFCSARTIEPLRNGKSRVKIEYHNMMIVFDEAKSSIIISFTEGFRQVTGMPKRIIKKDAFPVSLRYSEQYFHNACQLYMACADYKASRTPDRVEKVKVLQWLNQREKEMKGFYFSYLIDVDMQEIDTFRIRIHLYYPYVIGLEHDSHKAFRKTFTTDTSHYKEDFWNAIKEHCDYTTEIMRRPENAERYSREADRMESFIYKWASIDEMQTT